jgi:hypothetical protein
VRRAAAGIVFLLAAPALAHWVAPESIVAGAVAESTRAAWGVEHAYRDEKAPRLLVIRVGPRWYERSPADRRTQATAWADLWRQNVPQGVVAILDAATAKPAVQFGQRGEIVGLLEKKSPAEEPPAARPGK